MRVHFCGVRGSLPAPGIEFVRYGGHTPCVALAHDGAPAPSLLLDGGTGLQVATGLLDGSGYSGAILLTHLHWDHILGLPFFSAGDRAGADVRLLLPQQAAIDDATSALSVVMSPPFFPIGPGELEGSWRLDTLAPGELEIEGFTVLAREVPHKGGRTYGYRVQDGERSIAYIPDHCPTLLGPGPDGLGEYHDAAVELASEVDVLIHDAHLLADELESQAVYGHAAAEYAVALGRHAGARAVALFHHRPDRTDAALDELAARLDRGQPPVSVAVQGSTVTL